MKKSSLFPVYLLYFLDNFSFAVVFPLFSSLILTTQFNLVPFAETLTSRTYFLGLLNASFPLALLIGAPIMGALSDHFGRKRTFFVTISAIILGNLATAAAIHQQSFALLLISRLFCGFFSSNLTLCLAVVSDLSHSNKDRAKNFGVLTAVGGVSWILAILAGGNLTARALDPNFFPSLPFLIVAGIGVINLTLLCTLFKESQPTKKPLLLSRIFTQIFQAFRTPNVRPLFIIQCLFMFGWLLVFQWFAAFSVTRYDVPRYESSVSLSLIGLCWFFGATFLNRHLIQHISLKKIPLYGLALLTLLLLAASFLSPYILLVALDCLIALVVSFTAANLFNLISLTARESIQGKVMGLSQSVITLAQFGSPLIGALAPIQNIPTLYRVAALALFSAFLLYKFKQKKTYAA